MNKLIVFSASWCKNCQPHKDRLKALGYEFTEMDAEDNFELAEKYQIKSLPTTLVLKDGKVHWRASGTLGENQLSVMDRALKEA